MQKIITNYFKFILLILLVFFPIFGNLNVQPIRIWDESRLAINAYQMCQDNDWLVTHYVDNYPDMCNTKPPLLIWFQVLLMKSIGIGELAMRLPSAIAAFLTCLVLLVLSIRYLKDFMFGFIAVLVLITTYGYINVHAVRTGDYDSLLTFFTTISAIAFFAYMENHRSSYLYLFFLCLALGVLTKSVTAVIFIPALVIYSLWQKQFILLLKNKHFYFGALLFSFIVLGYYLLREYYNPGYIEAVSDNELGGRYLKVQCGKTGDFWFYYNIMVDTHLAAWYLLVPCGLFVGSFSENKKIQKLTVLSALLTLFFFLVISTSQTKLFWYDCPLYPFISIIAAVFIHFVFIHFKNFVFKNDPIPLKYNVIPYVFLFLIFIGPYQKIINKTYYSKEISCDEDLYQMSYYIRSAINYPQKIDHCFLLIDDTKDQFFLYLKVLEKKGVHISFKTREELKAGDTIIMWEQHMKDYIAAKYNYEIVENYKNISKYKLIDAKIQ